MKGGATKATPPSEESTDMGKDYEGEQQNPSCSSKSKADKNSGDDGIDRTGIESIIMAAAAVGALLGPVKRKSASAAMAPKKTKVKKPSPKMMTRHFGNVLQNSASTRLITIQRGFPGFAGLITFHELCQTTKYQNHDFHLQ
jgi:hypothetical protein